MTLLQRVKDKKVGEGMYAVVYQGVSICAYLCYLLTLSLFPTGREGTTGRRIAIKKIKVGQFKDGLDMSAIREVKYLRELHHPNVIEVTPLTTVSLKDGSGFQTSSLLPWSVRKRSTRLSPSICSYLLTEKKCLLAKKD